MLELKAIMAPANKTTNYPITQILAQEIKDSRGNPTIKVTISAGGASGSFSVPSGASTGKHEAHELRDPVPEQPARQLAGGARYGAGPDGKGGMSKAIWNIKNIIAPALLGQDVGNQQAIDKIMIELDGTPNKDNLGGNAMIGVSVACAKAAAASAGQEVYQYLQTLAKIKPSRKVPYLFMNLIEGGKHTDNGLAFQEYHVVPETEDVALAIQMGIQIQNTLKEIIRKDLGEESVVLGDEGGFSPKTRDIRKPLLYLTEAIKQNNLQEKVHLTLDVAASSFYKNGIYQIAGKNISKEELMSIYDSLISEFDLLSIEDPFDEEDFEDFTRLYSSNNGLARKIFIVGDDLTVSNKMLLQKALDNHSVNALIIKPNQIGTLSEMLETMKLARENGVEIIVSHRSGETDDDFIADLAYAFGCFGLKAGSSFRPERMIKYQRLINISHRPGGVKK